MSPTTSLVGSQCEALGSNYLPMDPTSLTDGSSPRESEPVMECNLELTTLSGAMIKVSMSVAKFDRLADFEDHVVDYLASVTDLKVFGRAIDFLHMATKSSFLHDWRRYVRRFCTSHLSRVKRTLQYRLQS